MSDIEYDGYVVGGTTNQLVLQFDVDYDSTDNSTAYQGRLTFVPNDPPPADSAWRHLNALTDGEWYASQAPGDAVCNQATTCTWSEVLAAFPDAAMRNDTIAHGAFLFRLGGPISGGAQAYVDKLSVTINSDTTVTDFEPGGTVTPTTGLLGAQVTLMAYGVKPGVSVNMYYMTNINGNKTSLCHVAANIQGIARCQGNIPATPDKAGPYGTHTFQMIGGSGGSKVEYFADFQLLPPSTPPANHVVRTLTTTDWFGGNEGPGGSLGNVTLVEGPNPAPLGIGTAALDVDDTGRASLGTNAYAGTRLDAFTDIEYDGYVVGAGTNQLVLQFDVDYDSTDLSTASKAG